MALLAIYSHYFNLKNSFSINKNPSKENITITDVTYSKNVLLPNDLIDIEIKIFYFTINSKCIRNSFFVYPRSKARARRLSPQSKHTRIRT